MQTYKDYAPTGFDVKGLNLPDRQDWLVVIGRNRDSDCLANSNFDQALEMLGGESDDCEVHSFDHWACGWLEIIIINPNSECAKIAQEITDRLADYPVLNEEDYSEREFTMASDYWHGMRARERVQWAVDARKRYHWLSKSNVIGYALMTYHTLCNDGSPISESICESLRSN